MPPGQHRTRHTIAIRAWPLAVAAALVAFVVVRLLVPVREPPASPERAVLDAALASLEAGERAAWPAIAPRTPVMSPAWFPEVGAELRGPDAALWHRLARAATEERDAAQLPLPSRAWVLSPAFASALDARDESWLALLARVRLRLSGNRGIVALSPVAFAHDGASALVYLEYRCGSLCGRGVIVWLERAGDGGWTVRERVPIWIS